MKVEESLADLRVDYTQGELLEVNCPDDPMVLFDKWINQAKTTEREPNAMVLATCVDNKPSSRIVLLKQYDSEGLVFFTNYESRKGKEMMQNPNVSATFWWNERSIRVEGTSEKIPESDSEKYFLSRPINSQWGAWTSLQSAVIESRKVLEDREEQLKKEFSNKALSKPPYWGGYRIKINMIEFWQGRRSRLHDRIVYTKDGDKWSKVRLSP